MSDQRRPCRPLRIAVLSVLLVTAALVRPVPASAAAATFEDRLLELVNGARAAAGVGPVRISVALAGIAGGSPYQGCGYPVAGRSADMGARNYFSHTILNCSGRTVADVLRAAGLPSEAGENMAWVSAMTDPLAAAQRLHEDLMASPAHRANILNPAFTHIGIGYWHSAPGATWSGGGQALTNVHLTTEVFSTLSDVAANGGGRYHAVTPSRLLDTRTTGTPLAAGRTIDLQVGGRGGVPATGASAVVMNVTVTGPTALSYLTVFPAGEPIPLAANLNFGPGQTVPNLVTAKIGAGGRVSLFNAPGTTDVVADLAGWYDDGAAAGGALYHPLTPGRILDTRAAGVPIGASATMNVQVTGQAGVPATGVSAVVMNVTVTAPTAPSYLTVYPAGEALPLAANLNFTAGQTVPNLVTAKLGAGGRVSLFNAAGATHVVADVGGWFDDGTATTGARFHPVTPARILDTRVAGTPLGALDLQATGQGGVPATGVSAVVMNVTVTQPTAPSYLVAYPAGEPKPWTANLNFLPGQTVPNLVIAKAGAGGRVSIANAAGTTHVIADVAGWFDAG